VKQLVTGLVVDVGWEYVSTWVESLRASGYSGEAALVTMRCEPELYEQCAKYDVRTFNADPEELNTRVRSNFVVGRFLPFGRMIGENYPDHFVLATDVRDVFFQRDPFEFFAGESDLNRLFVSPEEVAHDDGSLPGRWNARKMEDVFSERIRQEAAGLPIYCAGIICGPGRLVADVFRIIYLLCFNYKGPGGDQVAYCLMLEREPYRSLMTAIGLEQGWAVNWGAITRAPIPEDKKPVIENGVAKTRSGNPFHILHQYDRVPAANELVSGQMEALRTRPTR
jgi:hypothetical protein